MKIAVVLNGHFPSQWAHSLNCSKHANGFKNLGHNVEIFSIIRFEENKNIKKIKDIHNFYDIHKKIKLNLIKDYLHYFREIKPISYFYYIQLKYLKGVIDYIFDPEKKIANEIKNNNFDLVYCRSIRTTIYLIKNKIPVILETHSKSTDNPHLKKLLKFTKSKYFIGISTISEKLKNNFIKFGIQEDKILVQEDAVDIEKFDKITQNKIELRKELKLPFNNNNNNKKIITYCGSLHKGKGIDNLIKVAKELQSNKNIIFLIIGGPIELKIKYENYCEKEKISNIIFLGFIDNLLVPKYLKCSDILIMLYSKNEKESIMDLNTTSPIKLFEYLASKKPIIVTKIPTIEKVVENEKEVMMVEIDNISDTVFKINKVLNNTKLYKDLMRNSYLKAKKYTYDKRCENLIKLFKNGKIEKN